MRQYEAPDPTSVCQLIEHGFCCAALRGATQTGFPVRSKSLLSRPDLAPPGRGAQRRGWEERSHPEPGAGALAASMARMASSGRFPEASIFVAPFRRSRIGRQRIHCEA